MVPDRLNIVSSFFVGILIMYNLIRISDAAALALHTVDYLARNRERYVRAQEIAEQLEVSEHHLQKVHQRLSKEGLIQSIRGPKGGVQLAKDPSEITLMEIYEAIEGPFSPNRCMLGEPTCKREGCLLGNLVEKVNVLVRDYFTKNSVADISED